MDVIAEKKHRSNFAIAEQKTVKLHKKMSHFCGNWGISLEKTAGERKRNLLKMRPET